LNESSPTLRRRELGALLREFRARAGLTIDEVAEQLLCSPSKISRIETARRALSTRDVRDLCAIYGVTDQAERDRLMALSRESRQRAWWQDYDLPYSTYLGLEVEASRIDDYKSGVVPSLLQTEDYARAVIKGTMPLVRGDVVEQYTKAILRRQEILTQDNPPSLRVILDEAVLHRAIGGNFIMAGQLDRIIEFAELPNIDIRVVSYEVGAHPGLDSPFTILEFAESLLSDVVYVEGLVGHLYLERDADVERYRQAFNYLSATALTPEASTEIITDAARRWQRHRAGDNRT
jgi:transcriptional regulator with XRE-family HTH domain